MLSSIPVHRRSKVGFRGHARFSSPVIFKNTVPVETGLAPSPSALKPTRTSSVTQSERRQAASLQKKGRPEAQPALESPAAGRYSVYALAASHLLIPHRRFARNSCGMCATKGGRWMGATICGVLLLDPSLCSPLELVKSMGDDLGSGDGIATMRPARNLRSN